MSFLFSGFWNTQVGSPSRPEGVHTAATEARTARLLTSAPVSAPLRHSVSKRKRRNPTTQRAQQQLCTIASQRSPDHVGFAEFLGVTGLMSTSVPHHRSAACPSGAGCARSSPARWFPTTQRAHQHLCPTSAQAQAAQTPQRVHQHLRIVRVL